MHNALKMEKSEKKICVIFEVSWKDKIFLNQCLLNFFLHSVCCFKLFWSHFFWQTLKKNEDSISSAIFSQYPPFFGLESTVPREIFEKHFSFMMIIIVITRVEDWAVSQNVVNFLHPSSQSLVTNNVGLQFGQTLYTYLGLGKC